MPVAGDMNINLKMGMYGAVRSLVRVLERGAEGKLVVDQVINACSAMQNLREAILVYRDRMTAENNEGRRNAMLGICLVCLFLVAPLGSYCRTSKYNEV